METFWNDIFIEVRYQDFMCGLVGFFFPKEQYNLKEKKV
jgi:hypothetical protein